MNQNALIPHMKALGVDWGASAEAVKKAFRNATRRAHPDVAGEQSTQMMAQINLAYEALKDGVPEMKSPLSTEARLINLNTVDLEVAQKDQDRMIKYATDLLSENGVFPREPNALDRILMRTPKLPIQVPGHLFILKSHIVYETASKKLALGTNYFVIPKMKVRGHDLIGTGELSVFSIEVGKTARRPLLARIEVFENALIPTITGLPVRLSVPH